MRQWTTLALAMIVSLAVATTADAKKPAPADPATTTAAAPATVDLTMQKTGIADVDNIFSKADEPLKTLNDTKAAMDGLTKTLNQALGLADTGSLTDAINDLKTKAAGKVTVAMNDKQMPTLKPSDAVPENVQKAIDSFNKSIDDISALIPKLASLPQQFKDVAAAAAAINPSSLTKSGVKPTQAPKILGQVKSNISTLGKAPEVVTSLMDSSKTMVTTVTSAFGG